MYERRECAGVVGKANGGAQSAAPDGAMGGMSITTLHGDCRGTLKTLPDASVQCCVTSPPYFGLRKYSDDPREIGQEATPAEYVAALVEVFREVRRVLRDDGVLWLNLGDSYAGGKEGHDDEGAADIARRAAQYGTGAPKALAKGANGRARIRDARLDSKNLLGIPWRVAFALQDDGWILRSDVIWSKPNAMPESVTDRPTRAHEYVFLFSKSRRYFYDADAIREPYSEASISRMEYNFKSYGADSDYGRKHGALRDGGEIKPNPSGRNRRTVWTIATQPYSGAHYATMPEALIAPCILAGSLPIGAYEPDEFIHTPIGEGERGADLSLVTGRAGFNRPRRAVEDTRPMTRREQSAYAEQLRASIYREQMEQEAGAIAFAHYLRTDASGARPIPPELLDTWIERGWLAPVNIPPHMADASRSTVLDPFAGSGTVGRVALRLQRRAILCELNAAYIEEHIEKRTNGVQVELFV